jgi:hypothetical protein
LSATSSDVSESPDVLALEKEYSCESEREKSPAEIREEAQRRLYPHLLALRELSESACRGNGSGSGVLEAADKFVLEVTLSVPLWMRQKMTGRSFDAMTERIRRCRTMGVLEDDVRYLFVTATDIYEDHAGRLAEWDVMRLDILDGMADIPPESFFKDERRKNHCHD